MKTTIRIFATLVLLAGFAVSASAQNPSATATGRAEVFAPLIVTSITNLNFGAVVVGQRKVIGTINNVIGLNPGGTISSGRFSVAKGANTAVTLQFSLPAVLNSGINTLPIHFTGVEVVNELMARLHVTEAATDGLTWDPTIPLSVVNGGFTQTAFTASQFYVSIGGAVVPATNQATGVYEGTITLTATYN